MIGSVRVAPSLLKPLFKLVSSSYTTLASGEMDNVTYSMSTNGEEPIIHTEKVEGSKHERESAQQPSKDSVIRWVSLVIYLIVTTPLIFVMVVLVASSSVNP